jgi:uncharacterized protein YjdB
VATVNSGGLVTAVANGTTTITATTDGGSGTAELTVEQVIASVNVSSVVDTLESIGDTTFLTVSPKDANGHHIADKIIIWAS